MMRFKSMALPVCGAMALLVGTFAIGQSSNDNPPFITEGDALFSRAKIIELNGRVVRLDTATGEISRFKGDLSGGNARGTFREIARPVTGSTSGFLEVQQAGEGIFLVDVVTGQTWILRVRDNNSAWIEVSLPND
jgi:hypothetical protein